MILNIIYTLLRLVFLIAITFYIGLSIADPTSTWTTWMRWLYGFIFCALILSTGADIVNIYNGKYPNINIWYVGFYAFICIGEITIDILIAVHNIKALKKDKTN